jgi:O-antigen/teichoic acid export membrane protein
VWLFIPAIIASSLFPAIVNAKSISIHEYKKRLIILSGFLLFIGILVALPLSLFAEPLMILLYGPAFAASATVFVIYVWAGIWTSLDIVTRFFLIAENRRILIFITSCVTAVLNILLNLYLIPKFGIAGAAWSTFISYIFLALPFMLILRLDKIKALETT